MAYVAGDFAYAGFVSPEAEQVAFFVNDQSICLVLLPPIKLVPAIFQALSLANDQNVPQRNSKKTSKQRKTDLKDMFRDKAPLRCNMVEQTSLNKMNKNIIKHNKT